MIKTAPAFVLSACLAAPGIVLAQGEPVGPEFRVNTYTTDGQLGSSIALDAVGNFVVVWVSMTQDGSSGGIFGQRYASTGAPLGGEFRVNTYTMGHQGGAYVASDYDGNFVVVWGSAEISAQRFDAGGTPLGGEFRVNSYTTGWQSLSAVASDPAGNFVVTWSSRAKDGYGWGVFAQRYASTGDPMGGEFQVNTYTPHSQYAASVAMDALGNFVIAWQGARNPAGKDIFAQRYSSSGMPLGGEFRVNTYTSNDQRGPAIASDSAGDFIIVWESRLQDGSLGGIFGQRYARSGTPLGAEFRINTATAFDQYNPSVASDPDGNLVVAWISPNPSFVDIFAQRFSSSGVPLGGPSRVNTYTTGNQIFPFVSTDPAGNYVVTWTSAGSPAQDGSGPGIFAQRYNMILP